MYWMELTAWVHKGNYRMVIPGKSNEAKWPGINGVLRHVWRTAKEAHLKALLSISVDNVDNTGKIKNAGGTIALDKMEVPWLVGWPCKS